MLWLQVAVNTDNGAHASALVDGEGVAAESATAKLSAIAAVYGNTMEDGPHEVRRHVRPTGASHVTRTTAADQRHVGVGTGEYFCDGAPVFSAHAFCAFVYMPALCV